jgi:hypothetical protein
MVWTVIGTAPGNRPRLIWWRPASGLVTTVAGPGFAFARLRRDSTTADRWALCVSVAPLTRTAATVYAATGPTRTPPTLRTVLHQATAIARLAVLDPPEARDLAIQDHPIPSTTLTTGLSPLRY